MNIKNRITCIHYSEGCNGCQFAKKGIEKDGCKLTVNQLNKLNKERGLPILLKATTDTIRFVGYSDWFSVHYMSDPDRRSHCVKWVMKLIAENKLQTVQEKHEQNIERLSRRLEESRTWDLTTQDVIKHLQKEIETAEKRKTTCENCNQIVWDKQQHECI
jgi:hypothetical protein